LMLSVDTVNEAHRREKCAGLRDVCVERAVRLKPVREIEVETLRTNSFESVTGDRAAAGDMAEAVRLASEEGKTPREPRSGLEAVAKGVVLRLKLEETSRPSK